LTWSLCPLGQVKRIPIFEAVKKGSRGGRAAAFSQVEPYYRRQGLGRGMSRARRAGRNGHVTGNMPPMVAKIADFRPQIASAAEIDCQFATETSTLYHPPLQ
jgi:hypothetical protein